jgi:outer membrane protein TolC
LAAQNAKVGVAIADYFPKFSLTGNFGYLSRNSGSLFESNSQGWGIAPNLSLPLFEGGRISENVALQKERFAQASSEYQKTVLLAVEETENALSGYVKQRERQKALSKALESSQKSLTLSKDLYQQGIADFQRVLDAERVSFLAEDELVQSEKAALDALILSYKALGGGWRTAQTQ